MRKYPRIGFIINDATSDYSKSLIEGMRQACKHYECTLFIFPVGEYGISYSTYQYQKRAVASLINKFNLDGLIFSSTVHGTHVTYEELLNYIHSFEDLPIVSLGVDIPGIPSIMVNCRPGLEATISHMIEKHQCKKLALMAAGENSLEAEERTKVYRETLLKHNIPVDESLILSGFFSYSMAKKAMINYVEEHGSVDFDGIICLNDLMAFGVIDFCKENNIEIPKDLKVTGFDDIERAALSYPSLSSINQQTERQGFLAVETLAKKFSGREESHIQTVPTKVRYRQTCGCIDCKDHYTNYCDEEYKPYSRDVLASEASNAEWIVRKDQLVQIENYYSNTQTKINLYEFTGNFKFVLTDFSIGAAALVMYENPIEQDELFYRFDMPHKASILAAFDNSINYSYKRDEFTESFDPTLSMLPDNTICFYPETYYVVTLSHCEKQYGYLIYKPGVYDVAMYEFITIILSSQLATAFEHSKNEVEIQELDKNNKKLQLISRTDELTKILNRRGFMELGQEAINLSLKRHTSGLVIFGDMDGLKKINDTYGHDAGDRAIIAESGILQKVFRNSDIIGRMGGDEFAIVAPGLDANSFKNAQSRLENECLLWNKESGEEFSLSISLGYTQFNSSSFALSVLLQEADAKQYKEKRLKKERNSSGK